MESRRKYSQEEHRRAHNGLHKDTGILNIEAENLQSNLPRNKPGYGEKAFTYLKGDAVSIILSRSRRSQSDLGLNSSSTGIHNVDFEVGRTETEVSSKNNFFRCDTVNSKEINKASDIKTLNTSDPTTTKSTSIFLNSRTINSHRMQSAVQVLPKFDSDSRKHITKSKSVTENNNRSNKKDAVPDTLFFSRSLPRTPSTPLLISRNNRSEQNRCTESVLHCDMILETDDFSHHIYEEIDDVIENVISVSDSKLSMKTSSENQSHFEHSDISAVDLPEEGKSSRQLVIEGGSNPDIENHSVECSTISTGPKITNIHPHPVFQAEIISSLKKIFTEQRTQTETSFKLNSDLDSSLIRDKAAKSWDRAKYSENAPVRKRTNTFEQTVSSVYEDENMCAVPHMGSDEINRSYDMSNVPHPSNDRINKSNVTSTVPQLISGGINENNATSTAHHMTSRVINKNSVTNNSNVMSTSSDLTSDGRIDNSNFTDCTGRNFQQINVTGENINCFERSKSPFDEKKNFFEKFQHYNKPDFPEYEDSYRNMIRSTSEKRMAESNEFKFENAEDRRYLGKSEDEDWMNYLSRPQLPLKSIHKQKSLSCSNLVQTFKLFSKRNSSDNTKRLLVETTEKSTEEKKENCISEASISKNDKAKYSLAGVQPQSENILVAPRETQNYAWFHQADAREAARKLLTLATDGAFLVRPASNPSTKTRYTLCVLCARTVYNMHIRDLKNGYFALGEKKEKEKIFSSLLEMVRHHQNVPIKIPTVPSGQIAHIYLLITPSK